MARLRKCAAGSIQVPKEVSMTQRSASRCKETKSHSSTTTEKDKKQESPSARSENASNARIIVCMKLNDEHELVKWTLTKLAQPGDSVIVVHVIKTRASNSDAESEKASKGKKLDAGEVLEMIRKSISTYSIEHDLSKITVTIQILKERRIGPAIAEVSHKMKATVVVLGKSNFLPVSWCMHSLGRYCIKNLSPYCKVMIVHKQKVVLKKLGSAKGKRHTLRMFFKSEQLQEDEFSKAKFTGRSLSAEFATEHYILTARSSLKASSSFGFTDSMSSQNSEVSQIPDSVTDESSGSDMSYCSEGFGDLSQGSPNSVLHRIGSSSYLKKRDIGGNILSEENSKYLHLENRMCIEKGNLESTFGKLKLVKSLIERQVTLEAITEEEKRFQLEGIPLSAQIMLGKETEVSRGSSLEISQAQEGNACCKLVSQDNRSQEDYTADPILESTVLLQKTHFGKQFSYRDLQVATCNFSRDNQIGTGGCSNIYKGKLPEEGLVAVKIVAASIQGEKEFIMEIVTIAGVCHQNLVQYIGFCAEGMHRLLVFNFVPNGNLQQNIYGDPMKTILTWKQRQKVALGAARGLEYLHFSSPSRIIHRDVKSSNILLTQDFEAQVSDFGLAKLSLDGSTEIPCSGVVGTFGYMAPEYFIYGTVNEKTDVFSFGVVLLEIISGRPAIDTSLPGQEKSLVQWARFLERDKATHRLVDRRLKDTNATQLKCMMHAAFECIKILPEDRPHMMRVVKLLDSNEE